MYVDGDAVSADAPSYGDAVTPLNDAGDTIGPGGAHDHTTAGQGHDRR